MSDRPPPLYVHGDPRDGPMVALRGQDEWIESNHPEWYPRAVQFGRRRWSRPFFFAVRLQPPADRDLAEFGREVAQSVGLDGLAAEPQTGDRAVFLYGGQWARSAGRAIERDLSYLARKLGDVEVTALAVLVWSARESSQPTEASG